MSNPFLRSNAALNSKGSRRVSRPVSSARERFECSPEFKGIETSAAFAYLDTAVRSNAALNSKGSRLPTSARVRLLLRFECNPEFKGIETRMLAAHGKPQSFECSPEFKGIETPSSVTM